MLPSFIEQFLENKTVIIDWTIVALLLSMLVVFFLGTMQNSHLRATKIQMTVLVVVIFLAIVYLGTSTK